MRDEEEAGELLDRATSLAGRAYKAHVRDLAEGILEDIVSGEIEDRDDFSTRIHETVDGDGWVIYTWKAKMVLMCSDNSGEGADEGTVDSSEFRHGIPWSGLAYCALERDVIDYLLSEGEKVGVDINTEDLYEEGADIFEEVRERLVGIVSADKAAIALAEDWRIVEPRDAKDAIADALEGKQPRLAKNKEFLAELADLYAEQWEETPRMGQD